MAKRYRPAISYRLREIPLKSVKVWKDAQARKLDRKGKELGVFAIITRDGSDENDISVNIFDPSGLENRHDGC